MSSKQTYACRLSLAFLWVFTGITSVFFAKDIGYQVLSRANIEGAFADFCLYSGAALDIAIGGWLLTGKALKPCYAAQIVLIVAYTALLTFIAPAYWLHPFGPLTKNVPILCLIYGLYRDKN